MTHESATSELAPNTNAETEDAPRPRLARPQRRAQLLEVALEVFARQGYHAASMDEIADQAGVSKPVLYQHFPGKLELYQAILDDACEGLLSTVYAALAQESDNDARTTATIDAYFRYIEHESNAFRLIFESDSSVSESVRRRVDDLNARCAAPIRDLIMEAAGLSREQAQLLAVGMVGTAQTAAHYWLQNPGGMSREEACSLLATLAWRGLARFPLAEDAENPN